MVRHTLGFVRNICLSLDTSLLLGSVGRFCLLGLRLIYRVDLSFDRRVVNGHDVMRQKQKPSD